MLNLRRIVIVGLCLGVILAACSSPTSAPPTPTLFSSSPQPTLPLATPVSTPESVGVGVPVIEYLNERSVLLVISSVTGKVFDAFTPIPLGENYNYAFAPDGRTLALVSNAQLYLIDLPSWKISTFVVGLYGSPFYSPDGTLLALASGGSDGNLRVLDARSGEVKASAQAGFSIRNVKFTTDGNAIMIYGPLLASTGIAANVGVSIGAPKAALFAVADLSVLWSVALNGIRDGVFPKKAETANTQDIYQPGAAWRYEPGIAFDPNRDVLYVVHGDEDKFTTIDFTKRKVTKVDVRVKTSWLDQLMALTAGVAHAKGMDGTTKQVVTSQDGNYLYVVGTTESYSKNSNGNWDVAQTFVGLQVIATGDGSIVDQKESEANSVTQSSDRKYLLLTGWDNENTGTSWTEVYDMASNKIVKHIDSLYLTPTRRVDGTPILVSNEYIGNDMCDMVSVDPTTWAIASDWKGYCVGWLIDP